MMERRLRPASRSTPLEFDELSDELERWCRRKVPRVLPGQGRLRRRLLLLHDGTAYSFLSRRLAGRVSAWHSGKGHKDIARRGLFAA
jgi:hypothetical protein